MLTKIPPAPKQLPPGPPPSQRTIDAVRLVLEGEWSMRAAARHIGVSIAPVHKRVTAIRDGTVRHEAEDSRNYAKRMQAELMREAS